MTYTCVGWPCLDMSRPSSSQCSVITSPTFSRARRPALIPSDCSLSAAETEDLVKTRTQQPLFPPPDPLLLQNISPASPADSDVCMTDVVFPIIDLSPRQLRETSPTSDCDHFFDTATIPPALANNPKLRGILMKARAQYARNRRLQTFAFSPEKDESTNMTIDRTDINLLDSKGPKRKHSTFVKEQELKCFLEDRAGTPHISNLQMDDDVSAQLNVEELSVGGDIAVIDTEGMLLGEPAIADVITNIPGETEMAD